MYILKPLLEKAVKRYRDKGISGVMAAVFRKIFVRPVLRIRSKLIRLYLRIRYNYVIQKYKNYVPPERTQKYLLDNFGVIWSMWRQGEDNCPTIVKLCFASLKRHCGNHKVIIITKDNYKDYVTLPEHIISKVKAGYISFTHLSDIIRTDLLLNYGGLWIDSTIFVADDIPDEAFSLEYYTIRYFEKPVYDWSTISFYRWAGFCFAAKDSGSLLFSFMHDMFYEYWKNHDKLMHYLLIDYFLAVAFDEFPEFRKAWEKIPVNNSHCLKLSADKKWDAEKYAKLRQTTRLFKITYKLKYPVKTASGSETVYGHLLSEYGITE